MMSRVAFPRFLFLVLVFCVRVRSQVATTQQQGGTRNRKNFLIIGASGSIGLALTRRLTEIHGPKSVIAALHRSGLPPDLSLEVIQEFGFDIQSEESIRRVLTKHKDTIQGVWNLAAPLSVDTASDPVKAEDITVGGMRRLLQVMKELNLKTVYFSDSIGSYGKDSPRVNADANWLIDNPDQDPGSDYGIQKRKCRELLSKFATDYGFDTRFAIIPGVLHTESKWGGGTTEYALDACKAAAAGEEFVCSVGEDVELPMIHSSDLIDGLISLMQKDKGSFPRDIGGVAISGFSFSPKRLFQEIQKYEPGFRWKYDTSAIPMMSEFANLWPDTLDKTEAKIHIDWQSQQGLEDTVRDIMEAHYKRRGSGSGSEL